MDGKDPWNERKEHEGLVKLPPPYKHRLYASIGGPVRRNKKQPVIILFTGGGAPCAVYVRLIRGLRKKWRVLAYDRAGYDRSEVPWVDEYAKEEEEEEEEELGWDLNLCRVLVGWETSGEKIDSRIKRSKKITARDSAAELKALLGAIGLSGPYVLVAHSYGPIIAREFIEIHTPAEPPPQDLEWDDCDSQLPASLDSVVGLALIDPGSELFYHTYKPSIPPPSFASLLEGIDVGEITHIREGSKLTDEEWKAAMAAVDRAIPAAECEDNRGSAGKLAERKQICKKIMDPWPTTVLRCNWYGDMKLLYDAGIKAGNGTEKERKEAQKFLWEIDVFDDELKAALIRLTGADDEHGPKSRYSYFGECGHDVPIRRPNIVIREVEWIMDQLSNRGFR